MYYCCGITEKGIMPHNEDAILVGKSVIVSGRAEQHLVPPFVTAVSDGVSGENAGEVASSMCLEKLLERFLERLCEIGDLRPEKLKSSLLSIHEEIAEYSRNAPESHNMQTTLCGIAVDEEHRVIFFNVGDSRLYRFRNGELRQLTRDQSLMQLLYEEGSITQEERRTHVHRNIIFPAFGNVKNTPTIDADEIEGGFEYGDVLLICSDGLSDFLTNLDMQEILDLPKSLIKRLEMLVKLAIERGSNDNISAVAVVMDQSI